jgi:hypothetical protein
MENISKDNDICPDCAKPLQASACPACGGKCYHRLLLISKRPCTICKGTGKEYLCSDQLSHHENEIRLRKQRIVDEWIRSYGQSITY